MKLHGKTEDILQDKIYDILSNTVLGTTYDIRLGVAKSIGHQVHEKDRKVQSHAKSSHINRISPQT